MDMRRWDRCSERFGTQCWEMPMNLLRLHALVHQAWWCDVQSGLRCTGAICAWQRYQSEGRALRVHCACHDPQLLPASSSIKQPRTAPGLLAGVVWVVWDLSSVKYDPGIWALQLLRSSAGKDEPSEFSNPRHQEVGGLESDAGIPRWARAVWSKIQCQPAITSCWEIL